MSFFRTLLTGKDNLSADIGRVLFAAAVAAGISLEVYSVVWKGAAFDPVSFGGAISALLVSGGAGLSLKAKTEPGA